MKYAVGVDIGGTNTRVALINEEMKIVDRVQFDTNINDPQITLGKVSDLINSYQKDICGIGLSCPGPLDLLQGKILDTPNLNGDWKNFNVSDCLNKLSGYPVYLENDANLAALAEAVIGQGKEHRFVQFLTISTGLGSGQVVDKEIVIGAHGFANEIANVCLWKDGPSHGAIYPGGIEAISSGTAITVRASKAGLDVKHAGQVNDLANANNPHAMEIMDDAKEYLANLIATIIAFSDPEIIILGGSVALKVEGFVQEVQDRVLDKVYDVLKPYVKIVKSNLDEDSGLLGAAYLAFSKQEGGE